MRRIILISPLIIIILGGLFYAYHMLSRDTSLQIQTVKTETSEAQKKSTVVTDYRDLQTQEVSLTQITDNLDAPWAFAWLPNGDTLITERFGALRIIKDGVLQPDTISGLPEVFSGGQGGLLDVTVHPKFEQNKYIFFSYVHGTEEGNRLRIHRAQLNEMSLENSDVIFEVAQTKTGTSHYGSRFLWLPDNTLLFSVGDGGNPPTQYNGELIRNQAQYLTSHLGKTIRINDDGSIPEDNPFIGRPDVQPEIFSYGHRNIQGLTYDTSKDRIIVSEHGSKGGDEVNVVLPGKNYGWPLATYSTEYNASGTPISPNQSIPNAQDPLGVLTPSIAPSSIVYYNGNKYGEWKGDVFLAAMLLRKDNSILAYRSSPAGSIIRIKTNKSGSIQSQELINVGDVRVRSVGQGPDGYLYVLTDGTARQNRPGVNAGALMKIEP